jgi:hypothetical protein
MTEERGMGLLKATMHRYYLVVGISLCFVTLVSFIITFLPSWSQPDPGAGIQHVVESGTLLASMSLLIWLVVITVVGRWVVISAMETGWGQRLIDALRGRLVLPGIRRPKEKEPVEEPPPPSAWEEEAPIPEGPVIVDA